MVQRYVRAIDVRRAPREARRCTASDGGKWKAEGPDLDGDDLDVVVIIEDGLLVVTVY